MPGAAGLIVGGLAAGANLLMAAAQKSHARKALRALDANQPTESLPNELAQNQELATLRANTGLPSEQYNNAMKSIQRQQMRSLRGALDRKGGLGLIAGLNDNANNAIGKIDVADANARLANEKTLMGVNNSIGKFKSYLFDKNTRQPWERKYQYNMGLLGSGYQNQANTLNSLTNLAAVGADKYLGNGTGTGARRNTGNSAGTGVGGDPNGGNLQLDEFGNIIY